MPKKYDIAIKNLGRFIGNQKGEDHQAWKGDQITRSGLHAWLRRTFGKPSTCENCGTIEAKRYDWANISGKYLRDINDFKRLCVKCHKKFDNHLLARGEKQGSSKLTENQIVKIRKMYKTNKFSQREIAKKFSVSQHNIHRITNNETWKHVSLSI